MNNWLEGIPALLFVALMGSGIVLAAWRGNRPLSVAEWLGWSWLAGTAAITVFLGLVGPLIHTPVLVLLVCVAAVCSGVLAWIFARIRPRLAWFPVGAATWEKWLALVPLAAVAWVFSQAFAGPLYSDALLIWEFKARAAFLNGGYIPPALFSDASRVALHPGYPLYLPLSELWVYLWLGECDQTTVKVLFPPFYFAAACLLWGGVSRMTGCLWAGVVAATIPIFIPELSANGAVLDGYADYPLGVFYLAAIVAVLPPRDEESFGQWFLAAGAAAMLPWIKQEGILLWMSFAIVTDIVCGARRWRTALWTVLPGALVMAAWKLITRHLAVPPEMTFLPVKASTMPQAISRIGPVANYFLREFGKWESWSLLWVLAIPAMICLALRKTKGIALIAAVVLPLILDLAPYLFTRLDLNWHLQNSCTRLVLHSALTAVLALGVVLVPCSAKAKDKSEEPDAIAEPDTTEPDTAQEPDAPEESTQKDAAGETSESPAKNDKPPELGQMSLPL